MSTVLLAALHHSGAAKSLEPLIGALLAHGHDVLVLTDPAGRDRLEALGAHVVPVADPTLPSAGQPAVSARARLLRLRPNVRAAFLDPVPAQWSAVQRVLGETQIDVVLTDVMFIGAGILAALPVSERPPIIALGLVPPPCPDLDVAPYGSGLHPVPGVLGRLRNAVVGRVIAGPILTAMDAEFRALVRSQTGYDVGSLWQLAAGADLWAQTTVPRFEYPRAQPPTNLRLVGPLATVEPTVPPTWWDPRTDPSVVVVQADGRLPLEHVVVPAIEAVEGTGAITVVSGTTRDETVRALGRPLPPRVHFEPVVPWSWLVPSRTTFVGTGDYVQVQHALRHGVPVVVSGASEPQVETKARVTWAGVGIDVREARPSSAMLADAIARARADPGIGLAVARIAAQMGRTDAELAICGMVEELAGGRRMAAPPAWAHPTRSAQTI